MTFVHNLPHSKNVDDELRTVQANLQQRLNNWDRATATPLVGTATQSGIETISGWRTARDIPIKVGEDVTFQCATIPQEAKAEQWRSAFANVSADQLVALVEKHGTDVYSANVREYLGTRSSSRNINSQIVNTATSQPTNFWVFNNGITAITRKFAVSNEKIECKGFAVINGAQTLGALFDARTKSEIPKILLLLRVVEANSPDFIQDVIRFNNTQNPIKAWELRAIDQTQTRLKQAFWDRFGLKYQLRRGVTRWSSDEILFEKLGPWLSAFYDDPATAHRNRPELFDNDSKYNRLFNANSDVLNLLFVYRLGEAVSSVKDDIRAKIDGGTASDAEVEHYSYFRYGAFTYALIYLCSEALRAIVAAKGVDFKARIAMPDETLKSRENAVLALKPLVQLVLKPLPSALKDKEAYTAFKSLDSLQSLAQSIQVTLEQLLVMQADALDSIRKAMIVQGVTTPHGAVAATTSHAPRLPGV